MSVCVLDSLPFHSALLCPESLPGSGGLRDIYTLLKLLCLVSSHRQGSFRIILHHCLADTFVFNSMALKHETRGNS